MSAKKLIYSVLLLAAIITVSPALAQISISRHQSKLDKGVALINNLLRVGDFERAILYLDQMTIDYGDQPKLIYLYKKAYTLAKMYPEWEEAIFAQMRKKPNDELLLAELGNVKFLQNDSKAADSLWELALDYGAQNLSAYLYVASYKLRYGDYEGAIAVYKRARIATDSKSVFSFELANVYESQRRYPEAINELFQSLTESNARRGMVMAKIGGFLKDSDNPDEIVQVVEKGARRFPGNKVIHEIQGEVYLKAGEMEKALETYKKIGKGQKDDGKSLCVFAERCLDNRAYDTAIRAVDEYLRITAKGSHKEKALLIKGKAQRAAGYSSDAIATLTVLSESARNRNIAEEAAYLAGMAYSIDLDDCVAALRIWGDLTKTGVNREIVDNSIVEMASCYLRQDKFAAAESVLTAMLKNRSERMAGQRGIFLLGELILIRGDYGEAKKMYENLAKLYPGDPFANNAIERLVILELAGTDEFHDLGLDIFAAGLRHALMDDPAGAAIVFSDSMFEGSTLADHAGYYAPSMFNEAGDRSNAIDGYKRYIELFPEGTYLDRAWFALGELYLLETDTYPQAISAFTTILEKFPMGPVVEQAREKLRLIESLDKIG